MFKGQKNPGGKYCPKMKCCRLVKLYLPSKTLMVWFTSFYCTLYNLLPQQEVSLQLLPAKVTCFWCLFFFSFFIIFLLHRLRLFNSRKRNKTGLWFVDSVLWKQYREPLHRQLMALACCLIVVGLLGPTVCFRQHWKCPPSRRSDMQRCG